MKKIQLLLAMLLVSCLTAAAQSVTATGKVTYADDGSPVIGATVKVKWTTTAVVTDVNGAYKITIPASAKPILEFSFVGLKAVEMNVPQSGTYDVKMESDAINVDEVIVTAQGMTRSQRSTGYSATVVKSDELSKTNQSSLMSGIQGKVAGVTVSDAGRAGASQKVIIRGISSFNNNQPLYVVDGVPINNDINYNSGVVDFGGGSGDINPADIESMTVLKGASATALYGSRAANGVIVVTTKRAKDAKIAVSYDGSITSSSILRVTQQQDKFGQGWPAWDAAENGSWGPRFDGRMHEWGPWAGYSVAQGKPEDFVVMEKPFLYAKDRIRNVFVNGFEMNNNLSISASGKNAGVVFSYGNSTSDGIVPLKGDTFDRNTFSIRGNATIGHFWANVNVNYVRSNANKSSDGAMYSNLMQSASDIDLSLGKDYNNPYFNYQNWYTWYSANPYWQVTQNKNSNRLDRIYGNIELGYNIAKGLKGIARLGTDFSNSMTEYKTAKVELRPGDWAYGHRTEPLGSYERMYRNDTQLDFTGMLQADYKLADERLSLGGFVGMNVNQRGYDYLDAWINSMNVPGWYHLENSSDPAQVRQLNSRRRLIGLMGQADMAWKNYLFLTVSLRNDWSSTLPLDANSFFYWGANLSFVATDAFPSLTKAGISFAKVRVAWGQTGNDAGTYRTSSWYTPARFALGFGSLNAPFQGYAGLTENTTFPNNALRPEITSEFEVGLNINFWDNRVRLDAAFYNKETKDQIINASLPRETGYTQFTQNVGLINNHGIELAFGITPIRTRDFNWDINMSFTKNWNEVKKLWNDSDGNPIDRYTYTSSGQAYLQANVGQALGTFEIPAYNTITQSMVDNDPSLAPHLGKVIVTSKGFPSMNTSAGYRDTKGTSQHDFVVGLNTNFSWKGLTLGATFDWRQGGYFYCGMMYPTEFTGNGPRTVYNDRDPWLFANSVKQSGSTYVENDIPITDFSGYWNTPNQEVYRGMVLPKTFLKLRELSLTYSLPKQWIHMFAKNIQIGVVGRNLFMWTAKENVYVDPEVTSWGNDLTSELGQGTVTPSYRSIGALLKITF